VRRLAIVVLAVLALCASGFVLASCGGDDESVATTIPPTTTETTTTTETATTTTETTPPKPAGPTVIRVTVANAAPEGGIVRESVRKGDRVVLVVTSDVSDHVHLHGYDIMRDVAPGRPARLPFTANVPGRFEAELEDRGVPIADITVSP
jgi:hypothetical protein